MKELLVGSEKRKIRLWLSWSRVIVWCRGGVVDVLIYPGSGIMWFWELLWRFDGGLGCFNGMRVN